VSGRLAGAIAVALLWVAVGTAPAGAAPTIGGCPVFPRSSPWNQRVDHRPVAHGSARLIAAMRPQSALRPGFWHRPRGSVGTGFPYRIVDGGQAKVPVRFVWAAQSDPGPYPLPADVPVEDGGDHHVLVIDRSACKLYELFGAQRRAGGAWWSAGSGAVFDLRSARLRPAGWTSADAAGLPIFPGLVREEEVRRGHIDHALRFTLSRTRAAYVWPARHFGGGSPSHALPPMGLRVRLKASVRVARFPRQVRPIVVALKRYGMLLADNGPDWTLSGAPSPRWDDAQLRALASLKGGDFEVVASR
jgi:hypothetical protein